MSTTYNIDFSEPTKAGFQIKSGAYNGPGGTQANTTLRLFGRGAREWGEAVDEDLVRLAENFASASPPSVAVSGQVWIEQSIYYRNTSVGAANTGWYRFNLTTKVWELIGGTGVVGTAPMPTPTVGNYYVSGSVLYGYYSLGKYEPAGYLPRASTAAAGVPGSLVPAQTLYVYDANANAGAGSWVPQSATIVTNGPTPTNPRQGMLWYNTATGNLSVWTGTVWQNTIGPTNAAGQSTSSGILNMSNFKIINLATPTLGTDATTKQYVDTAIAGVTGSLGNYLPLTGGTLSGPGNLVVGGTLTANGYLTANSGATISTLVVNTNSTLNGFTNMTGAAQVGAGLTVYNALNVATGMMTASGGLNVYGNQQMMNGTLYTNTIDVRNNAVANVGMSGHPLGAANKQYVDNADTANNNWTTAVNNAREANYNELSTYLAQIDARSGLGQHLNTVFGSVSCGVLSAALNRCGFYAGVGGGTFSTTFETPVA